MVLNKNKKDDTKQYNIDDKQYDWERLFEPQCSFSSTSYNKKLENNLKTLTSKRKPIYYQQQQNHYNGIVRHLPNLVDIIEEIEEDDDDNEINKELNNNNKSDAKKPIKNKHLGTLNEPNKEKKQKVTTIKTSETIKTTTTKTTKTDHIATGIGPIKLPNSSIILHNNDNNNNNNNLGSILTSSSVISLPDTSPTLPKLEELFLHSLPDHHIDQHQVIILPCPSQTLIDLEQEKEYNRMKKDEQYQRKERLKILSKIHYYNNNHVDPNKNGDDDLDDPKNNHYLNKWSKDAEVDGEKGNKEVAHPFLEQKRTKRRGICKELYIFGWWYKIQDFIVLRFSSTKITTTTTSTNNNNNLISQKNQKKPPSPPSPLTSSNNNSNQHLSFIYFLIGFLFPPFWIFWPYFMKHLSMSSTDFKWKSRSRFMFYLFLISLLVVFIFLLIFYPQLLGYR